MMPRVNASIDQDSLKTALVFNDPWGAAATRPVHVPKPQIRGFQHMGIYVDHQKFLHGILLAFMIFSAAYEELLSTTLEDVSNAFFAYLHNYALWAPAGTPARSVLRSGPVLPVKATTIF
jgi:hypothetical protein